MKTLALAVALFAVLAFAVGWNAGDVSLELLGPFALGAAFCCWRSEGVSQFLKIFIALFSVETIVFGLASLASEFHYWPKSLEETPIPTSLPLTVALFAVLVFAVSHIPVIRSLTRIADRFFRAGGLAPTKIGPFALNTTERGFATAVVVFLIVLNQAQVGISLRLNFFHRDLFNAIQDKNAAAFWLQLFSVFVPWVFVLIGSLVLEYVVSSYLVIRWRRWLTHFYISHWLEDHTHYRMSLTGGGADNPDQRISEDVARFIDGGGEGGAFGYGVYNYSIMLISTLSSLVSYAILLWSISANFTFPGTEFRMPGLLFWVALAYAALGTLITHLIGRPLVRIMFNRQRVEADFRFSLARLREYSEQVALLNGERAESASLRGKFGALMANYIDMINLRKKLTAFTGFYGQLSPIIPYVFSAPFYFLGKITLGVMSQTASAFGQVDGALNFFVSYYTSLAGFKAVLDRLTSFDAAIEGAKSPGELKIEADAASPALRGAIDLPNGTNLLKNVDLAPRPGRNLLVTGPSGSGKSTLFRALAGIWPFGAGEVFATAEGRTMLLPQKPYVPIGALRNAVIYPAAPDSFSDAAVSAALRDARLPELADKLDETDNWPQRLSGGELQRLAIARALLAKPDWLLLDEATSALDEETEAAIYAMLAERLPHTTLISIGHNNTLAAFHSERAQVRAGGAGATLAPETV